MSYDFEHMTAEQIKEAGLKRFRVMDGSYSRNEKGGFRIYNKGEIVLSTRFALKGIHNLEEQDIKAEVIEDVVKNSLKAIKIGGGWYDVINEESGKKINTKALREEAAKALVDKWEPEEEVVVESPQDIELEDTEDKEIGCSYPENKTTKWIFGTDFEKTIDCNECMLRNPEEYRACETEHDQHKKIDTNTEETEAKTETEEDQRSSPTENN